MEQQRLIQAGEVIDFSTIGNQDSNFLTPISGRKIKLETKSGAFKLELSEGDEVRHVATKSGIL